MSSQGSNASSRGGRVGGRGGRGPAAGQRGGGGFSVAAATASAAGASRPHYVVPKAKNPANQPLLESLALSRSNIDPNRNKFAMTLKNAMDNLAKNTAAVTSYKEACQVRGIGQKIAHMMFPNDSQEYNNSRSNNSDGAAAMAHDNDEGPDLRTTIDGGGLGRGRPPQGRKKSARTVARSYDDANNEGTAATVGRGALRATPWPPSSPQGSVASHGSTQSTASTPTRRQLRYHKERSASDHQLWKNQNLVWNVLFLIDNREKKDGRDRLGDKFSSANIPFEVRPLPIGDMTWIAQGRKRRNTTINNNSDGTSPSKGPVVVELVLGTIIERKTLEDLKASIYGTRYAEQRMRMAESGVSQCVLLVEGNLHREAHASECHNKFLETCHTALWETCLYLNFQILRTSDLGETIATLKLLHRRILQRSFPHAFSSEVLPTFDGPNHGGGGRSTGISTGTARDPRHQGAAAALEAGQRRRRRFQSLHKLAFDTIPVMPPGMDRYVTYNELKAKIGRDREAGLRTVRMVHGAMVKQVPKIENKKAAAIVAMYPTPHQLFEAYHQQPNEAEKQLMLRDVDTAVDKLTTRKCTVGLEASKQMYVAYGMSKTASERPSYADHVERVQQEQQQRRRSLSSGGTSSSSGEKRPASRRTSFDGAINSFDLSQASNASSTSQRQDLRFDLDGIAADGSSRRPPATKLPSKPPPAALTAKPPPPSSSTSSSASRPAPQLKPPPAASSSKYRRSQSQESSSSAISSQPSDSLCFQGTGVGRSAAAAVGARASQEAIIDLCDDGSSDEEEAKRSHRSAAEDDVHEEEEEDDDDDYNYSPVVKDAAYRPSVREPFASLLNGAPTAEPGASETSRPVVPNPYSNASRTNRYSLGSLSASTASSSSSFNARTTAAVAIATAAPSTTTTTTTTPASTSGRQAPLTLNELGLEGSSNSSSSSDDSDLDDSHFERARRAGKTTTLAKKPPSESGAAVAGAGVARLPQKRKAREPEVYELLSD